jgi:adenine deaminase
MEVKGRIVDWQNRRIFEGRVLVQDGFITAIEPCDVSDPCVILPGFIDSHVHIESSMLMPAAFSRLALKRGTVGVVADPHEIANVLGVEGVALMLASANQTPLDFFFGAPSCVPATDLDASGARLDVEAVAGLLRRKDVWFLSEMMNFPGVLAADRDVMGKIQSALSEGKPVDGHAPGLIGADLVAYCKAGITTDHESFTLTEAIDKISNGMMIQIREGSAARNFDALYPLITTHTDHVMLCTDDCHPDELIRDGHIDRIVKKSLKKGVSLFDVVRAATVNPVLHYNLPIGLLRVGDRADFIVIDDLESFNVLETYVNGQLVCASGKLSFPVQLPSIINHFNALPLSPCHIGIEIPVGADSANVIGVRDGQLVTDKLVVPIKQFPHFVKRDILKLVVYNRYEPSLPAVGYVHGMGLTRGAIASSVAHDGHHIVAVGVSDDDIIAAINRVVANKGGIVAIDNVSVEILPLPIAGIISDREGDEVADMYERLDAKAKALGSALRSPFMTLSFLSLLVIPDLKLGSKGLFDVNSFMYVPLFNQSEA